MMRRLVLNLDEDLDLWLSKQVNQNETIRNALYLYKDDISTPDTIAGLRKSYEKLITFQKSKYEYYDAAFARMDKLISVLENRLQ